MKFITLLLLLVSQLLSSLPAAAVNLTQSPRPQIQVSAAPNPGQVNQEITFTVNIFNPPPCGWQINYGDGPSWTDLGKCDFVTGSGCLYNRKYKYGKPGQYLVVVKAKDPACEKQYQISPARLALTIEGVTLRPGVAEGPGVTVPPAGAAPGAPAPLVPDTTLPAAPALRWPDSLPAGMVGVPYSFMIKVEGAAPPVLFSLSAGSLPSGLRLDPSGFISGTPTAAGKFPLMVQLQSGKTLSRKNYLLEVILPAVQVRTDPPSLTVPRSGGTQQVVYHFSGSGACNLPVTSGPGFFIAAGETMETTGAALQGSIQNGSGRIQETITLSAPLIEKILSRKTNQFLFQRVFNGNLIAVVSIQIAAPVSGLDVRYLNLYFDNRRPEITVDRNAPGLLAYADIGFQGSGLLQGYWTVDGRVLGYVNQFLNSGQTITLKSPEIPALPTFDIGTHQVQLVLTAPVLRETLPKALYFVTSREHREEPTILLGAPENKAELDYSPFHFDWKPVPGVQNYLLEAFAEGGEKPVFSAYAKGPSYAVPPPGLGMFAPGGTYRWRVQGFNAENRPVARSAWSHFSFSDRPLFRPGVVLVGFEELPGGTNRIAEIGGKYSLKLLEVRELKSIGLRLALFQTEGEVFGLVEALAKEPGVVSPQPDYIFGTLADPQTDLQKVTKVLHLSQVHKKYRGRGVTVAVIDTGVDIHHRDLKGRVAASKNFFPHSSYQGEIHGTAVAGIIAAASDGFGIEGIAPQAGILALRACRQVSADRPEGECYSSTVAAALDQAFLSKARVVNLSLGAGVKDPLLTRLLDEGGRRKVLFTASAGNRPTLKEPVFPASHPAVVAVAGLDDAGRPYPNAELASKVRVLAPATGIFTTIPGDRHNFLNGTSMASAVVGGILALAAGKDGTLEDKSLPPFQGDLCRWQEELLAVKVCGR
ncbi:MAG: S8 family serine peptidase [Desulfobacterota bacterium]|nr:S8 family serine peptidase [Thermodesulfobacteriota bacterium]